MSAEVFSRRAGTITPSRPTEGVAITSKSRKRVEGHSTPNIVWICPVLNVGRGRGVPVTLQRNIPADRSSQRLPTPIFDPTERAQVRRLRAQQRPGSEERQGVGLCFYDRKDGGDEEEESDGRKKFDSGRHYSPWSRIRKTLFFSSRTRGMIRFYSLDCEGDI